MFSVHSQAVSVMDFKTYFAVEEVLIKERSGHCFHLVSICDLYVYLDHEISNNNNTCFPYLDCAGIMIRSHYAN